MRLGEWIATILIGILLYVGVVILFGLTIDRFGEHQEQIERCQSHAATPADYRRC
jgi:hypothetical protein